MDSRYQGFGEATCPALDGECQETNGAMTHARRFIEPVHRGGAFMGNVPFVNTRNCRIDWAYIEDL
jgi:hypothetical protein